MPHATAFKGNASFHLHFITIALCTVYTKCVLCVLLPYIYSVIHNSSLFNRRHNVTDLLEMIYKRKHYNEDTLMCH